MFEKSGSHVLPNFNTILWIYESPTVFMTYEARKYEISLRSVGDLVGAALVLCTKMPQQVSFF